LGRVCRRTVVARRVGRWGSGGRRSGTIARRRAVRSSRRARGCGLAGGRSVSWRLGVDRRLRVCWWSRVGRSGLRRGAPLPSIARRRITICWRRIGARGGHEAEDDGLVQHLVVLSDSDAGSVRGPKAESCVQSETVTRESQDCGTVCDEHGRDVLYGTRKESKPDGTRHAAYIIVSCRWVS